MKFKIECWHVDKISGILNGRIFSITPCVVFIITDKVFCLRCEWLKWGLYLIWTKKQKSVNWDKEFLKMKGNK